MSQCLLEAKHTVLQNLLLTGYGQEREKLFIRGKFTRPPQKTVLSIAAGDSVSFQTFYNSFSLDKWKNNTKLGDLFFNIAGSGKVTLKIYIQDYQSEKNLLKTVTLSLQPHCFKSCAIDTFINLSGTMLYCEVVALAESEIIAASFSTTTPVNNTPKIALVITHFNRTESIKEVCGRMQDEFAKVPCLSDKFHLFIIDNSKNSGLFSTNDVSIIPNENYGGTGGFTRGLLEAAKTKDFTHCLFMDDDANCLFESILRVYSFLSFCHDKKLAISGALFKKESPCQLIEKGSYFKYTYIPLYLSCFATDVETLLKIEKEVTYRLYGPWCFFAFPIGSIQHYPFPFFIRGDDVSFSLQNSFHILTLNGIATWVDDFIEKNSPITVYFDLRHFFVQYCFHDYSLKRYLYILSRAFFINLLSYKYATAEAVLLAAEHVLHGPVFFEQNISMKKIFPVLKKLFRQEAFTEDIVLPACEKDSHRKRSVFKKITTLLTLNGFLLPGFFFKDPPQYCKHGYGRELFNIFLYKTVYFYNSKGKAYRAEHNKQKFFKLFIRFLKVFSKSAVHFCTVKKQYNKYVQQNKMKGFWCKLYNFKKNEPE